MNESYQNQLDTLQSQLSIAISRIREMEDRFQCAKDITHMGEWEWDLMTQNVHISKEIYDIVGLNPEDVHLTMAYIRDQIIHEEYRARFKDALENAITCGQLANATYRIDHPTKPECWIRIRSKLISTQNNLPAKIMGVLIDVTSEMAIQQQLTNEKDFIETLIDNIPNPIFYKDSNFIYRYCNQAFREFIGYDKEQIIGKTVYDVAPPELAEIYNQADKDLYDIKGRQAYESTVKHGDGTNHQVLFNKGIHTTSKGQAIGIVGLMQDITESRHNEKQLDMLYKIKDVFLNINHNLFSYKDNHAFFTAIQSELHKIFVSCEQSSVLELHEDGYLRVLANKDFDEEESNAFKIKLEDSFIIKESGGKNRAGIVNDIQSFVSHGGPKVIRSKNSLEVLSTLAIPLFIEGHLKWIISLASSHNYTYTTIDLTVADYIREELPILYRVYDLYQKTLCLSRYDGLTQLYNRHTFDKICETTIDAAQPMETIISIVLFDLNGLKKVNDTYGHHVGDAYILAMKDFLIAIDTPLTTFSRIGGDEFAGMFLDESMETVLERIQLAQHEFNKSPINTEQGDIFGGFSFGIAVYGVDGLRKSELMRVADQRMYSDKKSST